MECWIVIACWCLCLQELFCAFLIIILIFIIAWWCIETPFNIIYMPFFLECHLLAFFVLVVFFLFLIIVWALDNNMFLATIFLASSFFSCLLWKLYSCTISFLLYEFYKVTHEDSHFLYLHHLSLSFHLHYILISSYSCPWIRWWL